MNQSDKLESYKKHKKYFDSYKPNDIFWGIGIENETYLEVSLPNAETMKSGDFFLNNHKSERYSVDYYNTYKEFNKVIQNLYNKNSLYPLPLLLNAHSFTKCDLDGEHQTIYDKNPKQNKNFSGKTLFELIKEKDSYFKKEYENKYCFDGDTIEFMTLNFYKTTIQSVIKELKDEKNEFLKKLNNLKLFKYPIIFPRKNHGFATFRTNQKNLAIFNNGTYHFNFTLPTQLNEKGEIADFNSFKIKHRAAIRCIQFFEPFFVALYGSPDPLTESKFYKLRYPSGSQRVAASRYISVGTYDTNSMITGKLLQQDRETFLKNTSPFNWYKLLYKQINYNMNEKIGFDINFNKFLNHGIEIRFFDWFDESQLEEVLEALVYILDYSQDSIVINSPINSEVWNRLMYRAILNGKTLKITNDELKFIRKILNLKIQTNSIDIKDIFKEIICELRDKYNRNGPCSKYMLEKTAENIIVTSNSVCCGFRIPKPELQLK